MLNSNPENGLLDYPFQSPKGKYYYVADSQLGPPPLGWSYFPLESLQLFIAPPSSDRIYQEAEIENCYLIAALLAIASHPKGQHFIQNMMIRYSETQVIVRLYHYISPTHVSPVFYGLDATILVPIDAQHFNPSKDIWVYFIEKAYAAHRRIFGERRMRYDDRINQVELLYRGRSRIAFEILLGKEGKGKKLPAVTLLPPQQLCYLAPNDPIFILSKVFIEASYISNPAPLGEEVEKALRCIFEYTPSSVGATKEEYFDTIRNAINDFRANYKEEHREQFLMLFKFYTTPRYETFKYYIDTCLVKLQPNTKTALHNFIASNIMRKRGAGEYLSIHYRFYRMMHAMLAIGNLVCIGTSENLRKPEAPEVLKGLRSNHEYQVINCYTRAGVMFLLIRQRGDLYIRNYYRKNWTQRTASESQDNLPKRNGILSANSQAGLPFQPVNIEEPFIDPALPITKESLLEMIKCDRYVCELPFEDFVKYFVCVESCDPGW